MRYFRPLMACLTGLTLLSNGLATAQAPAPVAVDVGGRKIVFPAPEGFAQSNGIDLNWDKTFLTLLPQTNHLLVTMNTTEEVAGLKAGKIPGSARTYNAQIVRQVEKTEIGDQTFSKVRGEIKSGIMETRAKMDAEIKKALSSGKAKLGIVDQALEISDSAILAFFEDTPTGLGFTMVAKLQTNKGTPEEKSEKMVVAALMIPVNGRLINLYANATYRNDDDLTWVQNAVKSWRDSVVAANPRVQGPDYQPGGQGFMGFDLGRITSGMLIGAAVGLAIAIFKWITTRKNPPAL